jgi:signal transduction histidine kinase
MRPTSSATGVRVRVVVAVLLVLAGGLVAAVPWLVADESAIGPLGRGWPLIIAAATLAVVVTLFRPPIGTVIAIAVLVTARASGQDEFLPLLATCGGLYALARNPVRPRRLWLVVAGTSVGVLTITGLVRGTPEPLSDAISDALAVTVAWLLGELARRRRQRIVALEERARDLEQLRRLEAETAAAAERVRVARELHDVLAHTVTAMVVQATAGRRALHRRPADAEAALAAIEAAGREALEEIRSVVSGVREGAPAPGLAALPDLVRASPVRVTVVETGTRVALPPDLDLTAYRIVQEALTNVRKYARSASSVTVALDWREDEFGFSITDDGRGAPPVAGHGGGLGLLGMRERVDQHKGTFAAGPVKGGWQVAVTLPVGSAAMGEPA